jgi:BTB/POZ domain
VDASEQTSKHFTTTTTTKMNHDASSAWMRQRDDDGGNNNDDIADAEEEDNNNAPTTKRDDTTSNNNSSSNNNMSSVPATAQGVLETDQAVISLNVGGTLYQVSRSLLAQHPETMLARLVSDLWLDRSQRNHDNSNNIDDDNNIDNNIDNDEKKKKNKNKKAIFIERNGARFGFVLDYLRDGSVTLPVTVAKAAFLTDLDYFGVPYSEEDSSAHSSSRIHGVGTVAAVMARGHHEADRLRELATIAKERADYCQLANEVFAEYCRSGRLKFTPLWISTNTVFEQSHLLQSALLSPHMEKFGLEVRGDPQTDWEGCLVLGHLDSP